MNTISKLSDAIAPSFPPLLYNIFVVQHIINVKQISIDTNRSIACILMIFNETNLLWNEFIGN